MPTESSAERKSTTTFPILTRLAMVALNCIPALHVTALLTFLLLSELTAGFTVILFFLILFVAPALIGRVLLLCGAPLEGTIPMNDKRFLRWWASFQLQGIFNRLTFLEEGLRLFPGLYSLWLRLWGSRIGRLTFWGAGTKLLDRSHLRVGDNVVFGAGVRLNPHVLAKNEKGELELRLGTIEIGSETLVGGYALITAGSRIRAGETTAALMIMPPFSVHEGGRRTKRSDIS